VAAPASGATNCAPAIKAKDLRITNRFLTVIGLLNVMPDYRQSPPKQQIGNFRFSSSSKPRSCVGHYPYKITPNHRSILLVQSTGVGLTGYIISEKFCGWMNCVKKSMSRFELF
jgi:hypothetical protein